MSMIRRSTIITFTVCLIITQMCFALPERTYADSEKAGETLIIRVGYFGEDNDYRVKAKLSNKKLKSLPQKLNRYTNMTRIGTIMSTIGEGPTLKSVLDEAGIDTGSVRRLHVRTTDSSGKINNWFTEFPADKYIGSTLYYYPNLVANWEKTGEGRGIPKEGALKGEKKVDAIIALKSYSTKSVSEGQKLEPSMMKTVDSYRLCIGQKKLKELKETFDVSSNESATYIFGIDVTLWGSPKEATGISLDLSNKKIKVGSTKRIAAKIKGQELFGDKVDTTLRWSSSNKDIATVDKKGNVTIKKEGEVIITAKTSNGLKKSVKIRGIGDSGKDEPEPEDEESDDAASGMGGDAVGGGKGSSLAKGTMMAKEVQMGDRIVEATTDDRPKMDEDAVELTEETVDPILIACAGITALIIFTMGIILRIVRYRREV